MELHSPVKAYGLQKGKDVTWPDVNDKGHIFIPNFFPFFNLHFPKGGGLCLHWAGVCETTWAGSMKPVHSRSL